MPVNLSIKAVPDELAERLRARAAHNHRSMQRELLAIVEAAAAEREMFEREREPLAYDAVGAPRRGRPIEEIIAALREHFPHARSRGTRSVDIVRAMRDGRTGSARSSRR